MREGNILHKLYLASHTYENNLVNVTHYLQSDFSMWMSPFHAREAAAIVFNQISTNQNGFY